MAEEAVGLELKNLLEMQDFYMLSLS